MRRSDPPRNFSVRPFPMADLESSAPAELPAIALGSEVRPKRTRRGFWIRGFLTLAFVALAVLAVRPWEVWPALLSGRGAPRYQQITISSRPPPQLDATQQTPSSPESPGDSATNPPQPRTRKISAGFAKLRDSIALVEADGPAGREVLGSAFVLNREGQLVTCLHVANRTTSAVVRFHDGTVYDVAGYAAVDPAADLAILQLKETPSSLVPATLATAEPEQLTPVVAWGHPQGIEFSPFDGKVSRLVKSSQLPAGLQKFVRELTTSDSDLTWLQHTARLSEGNSGGPLASEQGEVIGINIWVDRQTDYSYALPVAALETLLAHRFPEPEPLERFALAEARVREATWQTTAKKLREVASEARELKWQVHEWSDYARLQHLAWGVTLANAPEHFTTKKELGDRLDDLVKEADRVVAQLHQHRWSDGGQIIVLNEFAEKEIARPGAGVFFFGSVQRVVEGKQGERALLVRLAGFDQMLLVPVSGQLSAPEAGAQCLFVGVNDRGRTVRYGGNPLQPTVASVIIAPVIVPLK